MCSKHTTAFVAAFVLLATAAKADGEVTRGQVTKIDEAQAKLTIQHGPIKKFNMNAMEMVFKASDPAVLKALKVGDRIVFHADRVNGQLTATKVEKAK